jgi:hypothetical protein
MRRRRWRRLAGCLVAISLSGLWGACDNTGGLLPKSSGRPYEVLVVGDTLGIIKKILSIDTKGLPQREPIFDVSAVNHGGLNAYLRLARNIVTLEIDSNLYTVTRIRYEKNKNARPQMMVYIGTPSLSALKRDMPRHARYLRELFGRAESNTAITFLKTHRSVKAEKQVAQLLGVDMWIPEEMTVCKKGKDFIWLSNNSPTSIRNIVVYKHGAAGNTTAFIALRDSVMKSNIKGETNQMFMTTVRGTVSGKKTRERKQEVVIFRGLWEMRGDDMGGPFVSHTIGNVTAEAFLFAPGKKKRNQLRQLEAALYTLKQ